MLVQPQRGKHKNQQEGQIWIGLIILYCYKETELYSVICFMHLLRYAYIWSYQGPLLLTWINFNPNMEK